MKRWCNQTGVAINSGLLKSVCCNFPETSNHAFSDEEDNLIEKTKGLFDIGYDICILCPQSVNNEPKPIQINLGYSCNAKCIMCFGTSNENKHSTFLKQVDNGFEKEILALAKNHETKAISITGGEPFMYSEKLFKIIDIANQIGFSITIVTNGSIYDEKIINKLKSVNDLTINMSIDGHIDTFNSQRVGLDYKECISVYNKILDSLPLAKSNIITTITNKNIELLHSEIKLFTSDLKRYDNHIFHLCMSPVNVSPVQLCNHTTISKAIKKMYEIDNKNKSMNEIILYLIRLQYLNNMCNKDKTEEM